MLCGELRVTGWRSTTRETNPKIVSRDGYRPMAAHDIPLYLVFSLSAVTATAQPASMSENWNPISRPAKTITGHVTFSPSEITFQNGKSLPLASGGEMLFRSQAKKRKVMADLYRATAPDDPVLENGNRLCKGKPVADLLVWQAEKTGREADPRTFAPFSGPKVTAGSPDECGRYVYDTGPR